MIQPDRSTRSAACCASGTISALANGTGGPRCHWPPSFGVVLRAGPVGRGGADGRPHLAVWPLRRTSAGIRGTPTTPTIGQPDDVTRSSSAVMRETRATGPDSTTIPTRPSPARCFIWPIG